MRLAGSLSATSKHITAEVRLKPTAVPARLVGASLLLAGLGWASIFSPGMPMNSPAVATVAALLS